MNTNDSSNHTVSNDNIQINWPKLAVSSLGAVAVIYLCIWLLVHLFNTFFVHKTSPFIGLIPNSVPLAVEGSPDQVAEFLQKRCGLITDFDKHLSQKYPKARTLIALMPSDGLGSSLECQSYLLDLASNIEELWNKNYAYPVSVPPFPPCPAGGQAVYSSDEQQFTIICTGQQHRTEYNSFEGLAAPTSKVASLTPASNVQAPSNLPERSNRNFEEAAKERLDSLQDTPNVLEAIKRTDISANMQAQKTNSLSEATSEENEVSYYEKTITASGDLAEKLDNQNIPLGLQDLPSTFKFREPFIIAIANVEENLPECFRLPKFKNLQIWASSPESAQKILAGRTPKSESLFLESADTTKFQIFCRNSVFNELFQDIPLKLPADSWISLHQSTDSTTSKDCYDGEIVLPDKYKNQLDKITSQSREAEKLLSSLDPSSVSFSANPNILKWFSVPNLGWGIVAKQEEQSLELQPNLMGISLDSSNQTSLKQIFVNLAKAFKGRISFNASLKFDTDQSASSWSANSPLGPVIQVKGPELSVKTGSLSKNKAVSLPKGPTTPQVCGWYTVNTAPDQKTVVVFSSGTIKNEDDKSECSMWFKIEKRHE
ncbi:MAG: hypothetical protein ACI376_00695 [Candidatus Bruticola sp.]